MPLYLLVEGKLDRVCLGPVLGNVVTLEQGGSKNSLKPEAKTRQEFRKAPHYFLRDRDFDYQPPDDISQPSALMGKNKNGIEVIVGWHWCRYEIENYLLEPAVVQRAVPDADQNDYKRQLQQIAMRIRAYEAARWSIGTARKSLPPHYELQTRPDELPEIAIPENCSDTVSLYWLKNTVGNFRDIVSIALDTSTITHNFQTFMRRFDDEFCLNIDNILIWFAGKDLFAGLTEWCSQYGFSNSGEFRAYLRTWCADNPDEVIQLLPEWRALRSLLESKKKIR